MVHELAPLRELGMKNFLEVFLWMWMLPSYYKYHFTIKVLMILLHGVAQNMGSTQYDMDIIYSGSISLRAVIGLFDLVEELRVLSLPERTLRDMVRARLYVEYRSLAAY
jgi:hypothetical protein